MRFSTPVTVTWFREEETTLAWLSVAAMITAIVIQWIVIDHNMFRRFLTLTQVKVLYDAYASVSAGTIASGYATAKFAEAVYESNIESILQVYKLIKDVHSGVEHRVEHPFKQPGDLFIFDIRFSIFMSLNTMALVLTMFLEADSYVSNKNKSHKYQNAICQFGLFFYHLVEVSSRVFSLGFLIFAFREHAAGFSVAIIIGMVVVRLLAYASVRRCAGEAKRASIGQCVTSAIVDSVMPTKGAFQVASVVSTLEAAVAVLLYINLSSPTKLEKIVVSSAIGGCFLLKFILAKCVLEQFGKYRYIDSDLQENTEVPGFVKKAQEVYEAEGVERTVIKMVTKFLV